MCIDQPEVFAASKLPFDACFGATLLVFFSSKDCVFVYINCRPSTLEYNKFQFLPDVV